MDTSINSQTKLYTLVGYPVSHSISPVIQNSIFAAKQCNSKYITLAVRPESLKEAVTVLKENFRGFNVTIPHKQAIMDYLDVIEPKALLCGAVNTVKNDNGRLTGYNTDGYGFMKAFQKLNIEMAHKEVLLIGAGGAARAVLCELLQHHCSVTVINRTEAKAKSLQRELSGNFPGLLTVISDWHQLQARYDCLINTTSLGMEPNRSVSPIDSPYLSRFSIVYDLVYNPFETKLLAEAKRRGCMTVNGLPMLFYQAVAANQIWTDSVLPGKTEQELYEKTIRYLQPLVEKSLQ
ncbi:quinate/shikimate 5-dehydrogenase/glutamyl-trna reductase [Lucifera butyrica]|uniref:Shikimate dehydrogenase (NADP(+)) n=1 Tax=Lucifera butyrica TaxID=1351585 RepID=A0A498RDD3_9FIRM|nr:shikimate dehydrogenase [Lucifera butyrica]VBB08975.1 quinate/shikimate 5-dehydrogenase/glutamyl-trna reductase [Lucifera butyrica]